VSSLLFPQLPGVHWELSTGDEFHTLIQEAAAPDYESGLLLGEDPTLHFELQYSWLRQPGAQGHTGSTDELNALRGFFRACKGDLVSFLLYAPHVTENAADGIVAGQTLTPDTNDVAPIVVTRAGYSENLYELAGVNSNPVVTGGAAPVIKQDGVALVAGTDYTIQGPGYAWSGGSYPGLVVVFAASTAGHTYTADLTWYYRVRFAQKRQDFKKFLAYLYDAQKIQLKTRRNDV
jgi:uncharacterized protein DUF2460